MTASIPASEIVSVRPNVIGAGGNSLDLSGLVLTNSKRVPIGSVIALGSVVAVQGYFGPTSAEAAFASAYFAAFDGAPETPGALLFVQYPTTAVAAYLRGGSLATMTLAQLQGLSGVLTVSVDGTSKTSGTINLTTASSFSAAATLIQSAFSSPGFTVSYDSVTNAFVFTDATTGASSAMSFASGTLADPLALSQATGAVISPGAVAATPVAAMDAALAQTGDFFSYTTLFQPVPSDALLFASWANGGSTASANRFAYVAWDNSAAETTAADTSSPGYLIQQAGYDGTVLIYDPLAGQLKAAFVMGGIAAIDFSQENGRTNLAFRSQAGLAAGVSSQAIAENLIANGYNFYGRYATANNPFVFFYPGSITGEFDWLDSYVNQAWLNSQFQLLLMTLLTSKTVRSIPYNAAGYALIEAAMMPAVTAALNFGAIRTGVQLDALQAAEVNSAAGIKIDDTLQQRGWYVSVTDPGAQARAARGSPSIIFFYMDGGSIQKIVLTSDLVQ